METLNNRPLILGAPLGITLTPNHVLQGFRECFWGEVNPTTSINQQISRWNVVLNLFHSLWEQEYTRRKLTVSWKTQGNLPQVGDIVLFKNEPIYNNPLSAARVEQLLCRKNRDVYGATISYRREVGGRKMVVDRHLNQLYPFMNLETQCPQEMIPSLNKAMMGNRVKNEQPLFTFLLLLFVHPLFNIKTLGFKRILYNQSISSSQKI